MSDTLLRADIQLIQRILPHRYPFLLVDRVEEFGLFKERLTSFLMSIPDKPPVKGYSTQNSNSILDWRKDAATTDLWGGQDC